MGETAHIAGNASRAVALLRRMHYSAAEVRAAHSHRSSIVVVVVVVGVVVVVVVAVLVVTVYDLLTPALHLGGGRRCRRCQLAGRGLPAPPRQPREGGECR